MASIYHLNNPRSTLWDHPALHLENHPLSMPGPHRGPGPHHHHHGSHKFRGWGGPDKDGVHGHHGHHMRGRHGRHGRHNRHEKDQLQQNEGSDALRSAEQNVEVTPSTETLIPGEQENANESSSSDSDEPRRGHKYKHKGRHGAGKAGHGGEGCKGRRGHGFGHKGGPGGKFGGRGGHKFDHHGAHAFGAGFEGPFHGKHHHKGRHGHGHGRGMWHGGMFHESKRLHHQAMKHHHELMQQHHEIMQVHRESMRDLRGPFGPPFHGRSDTSLPNTDIFDAPTKYVVHVSLPGAKKSDLSIHYDAAESALRVTGVVHRPGMTEELQQALISEERSEEIGAFERVIRLGTRQAPASVLVDGIVAAFEDGVLAIEVPKGAESEVNRQIPVADCHSCDEMDDSTDMDDGSKDMDDMGLDDHHHDRVATPEADESDEEGRDYVKIAVQ